MRDQYGEVNRPPNALAQKKNVAYMRVEINVANQKQSRGYYRRDHAGPVSGDAAARDHVAAGNQKHRAGSVQTSDQRRKECVFLGDQAAGLLVRRLAIRNASPNITRENNSNVAMAEGSGKVASMPG